MLLGQGLPPAHRRQPSTTTVNGNSPGGELLRAKSEGNLSETEEAAMTLEDIGEYSIDGIRTGTSRLKLTSKF